MGNKEHSNIAIVSFKDLQRSGRMDAGFHVVCNNYSHEIEKVKGAYTKKEAREILASVDLDHGALADVMQLARGSGLQQRSVKLAAVVKEYPCEALAIVLHHKDTVIAKVQADVEKMAAKLRVIEGGLNKV